MDYKGKIIELVQKIKNEKYLEYIFNLLTTLLES